MDLRTQTYLCIRMSLYQTQDVSFDFVIMPTVSLEYICDGFVAQPVPAFVYQRSCRLIEQNVAIQLQASQLHHRFSPTPQRALYHVSRPISQSFSLWIHYATKSYIFPGCPCGERTTVWSKVRTRDTVCISVCSGGTQWVMWPPRDKGLRLAAGAVTH